MAEPLTWLALEALKTMLASIKIVNGYHTDLGLAPVYLDRSQNADNNTAFTAILAGEIPTNPDLSNRNILASNMDLTVEYCIPPAAGVSAELLAHRGRADLLRVLMSDLRGKPHGFGALTITGSRIVSAVEPGSSLVIAQVSARAALSESKTPAT